MGSAQTRWGTSRLPPGPFHDRLTDSVNGGHRWRGHFYPRCISAFIPGAARLEAVGAPTAGALVGQDALGYPTRMAQPTRPPVEDDRPPAACGGNSPRQRLPPFDDSCSRPQSRECGSPNRRWNSKGACSFGGAWGGTPFGLGIGDVRSEVSAQKLFKLNQRRFGKA